LTSRSWRLALAVAASTLATAAEAQEPVVADSAADSAHAVPAVKPDDGWFRFTPLLAPAYNPEMEFLIVGGALLSFKADPADTLLPRSTLSATVSLSTTGAVNVASRLNSYWMHDRLRVRLDLSLKDMEDGYWGVGFDAGLEPLLNDSTTEYQRTWWAIRPVVLWSVKPHLYVGGLADINRTSASEVGSVMAADSAFVVAGADVFNTGLGVAVEYDTRDVPTNAWTGIFLALGATFYGPYLGGDFTYQTLLLDYRQYKPLGRPGRTLAWQVRSRLSLSGAPWPELSLLGSGYEFRGYREGRFRAPQTFSATAEYRHMFTRSGGRLSRHGFTVFAGLGVLGDRRFQLEGPLPQVGAGYRFELQPRANVRIDFATGVKSTAVYFNFQEAF
jgi:hypothetical protein